MSSGYLLKNARLYEFSAVNLCKVPPWLISRSQQVARRHGSSLQSHRRTNSAVRLQSVLDMRHAHHECARPVSTTATEASLRQSTRPMQTTTPLDDGSESEWPLSDSDSVPALQHGGTHRDGSKFESAASVEPSDDLSDMTDWIAAAQENASLDEQHSSAGDVRRSDTVDTSSGWLLAPRDDAIRMQTGKTAEEAYGKAAVRFRRANWTTDRSPMMASMPLAEAMDFRGDGMEEWGHANVLPYLAESLSRPWHEQQDVVVPHLGGMRRSTADANRNVGLSRQRLQSRVAIQADAMFRSRRRRRERLREAYGVARQHMRAAQRRATRQHAEHLTLLTEAMLSALQAGDREGARRLLGKMRGTGHLGDLGPIMGTGGGEGRPTKLQRERQMAQRRASGTLGRQRRKGKEAALNDSLDSVAVDVALAGAGAGAGADVVVRAGSGGAKSRGGQQTVVGQQGPSIDSIPPQDGVLDEPTTRAATAASQGQQATSRVQITASRMPPMPRFKLPAARIEAPGPDCAPANQGIKVTSESQRTMDAAMAAWAASRAPHSQQDAAFSETQQGGLDSEPHEAHVSGTEPRSLGPEKSQPLVLHADPTPSGNVQGAAEDIPPAAGRDEQTDGDEFEVDLSLLDASAQLAANATLPRVTLSAGKPRMDPATARKELERRKRKRSIQRANEIAAQRVQWNQAAEKAAKQAAIVSKQEIPEAEQNAGTSDEQHASQTEVEAPSEHQSDVQSANAGAAGLEEALYSSAAIAQSIQADPFAARASHTSEAGELSIDLGQDTGPRAVNVKVRLRVEEPTAPRETPSRPKESDSGVLDVTSSDEAERKIAAYWDSVQSREKEASAAKRSEILSVSTPTQEQQHPAVAEAQVEAAADDVASSSEPMEKQPRSLKGETASGAAREPSESDSSPVVVLAEKSRTLQLHAVPHRRQPEESTAPKAAAPAVPLQKPSPATQFGEPQAIPRVKLAARPTTSSVDGTTIRSGGKTGTSALAEDISLDLAAYWLRQQVTAAPSHTPTKVMARRSDAQHTTGPRSSHQQKHARGAESKKGGRRRRPEVAQMQPRASNQGSTKSSKPLQQENGRRKPAAAAVAAAMRPGRAHGPTTTGLLSVQQHVLAKQDRAIEEERSSIGNVPIRDSSPVTVRASEPATASGGARSSKPKRLSKDFRKQMKSLESASAEPGAASLKLSPAAEASPPSSASSEPAPARKRLSPALAVVAEVEQQVRETGSVSVPIASMQAMLRCKLDPGSAEGRAVLRCFAAMVRGSSELDVLDVLCAETKRKNTRKLTMYQLCVMVARNVLAERWTEAGAAHGGRAPEDQARSARCIQLVLAIAEWKMSNPLLANGSVGTLRRLAAIAGGMGLPGALPSMEEALSFPDGASAGTAKGVPSAAEALLARADVTENLAMPKVVRHPGKLSQSLARDRLVSIVEAPTYRRIGAAAERVRSKMLQAMREARKYEAGEAVLPRVWVPQGEVQAGSGKAEGLGAPGDESGDGEARGRQ